MYLFKAIIKKLLRLQLRVMYFMLMFVTNEMPQYVHSPQYKMTCLLLNALNLSINNYCDSLYIIIMFR